MFSFEFNKIAGALLGACVFAMGLGIVAEGIYSNGAPAKAGYELPDAKVETAAAAPAPTVPLPVLLAKADVTKGQADTKVCQACHNFEKGQGVKVGPPLYGVVDRPKGSIAGFEYSAGLKAKGGNWTFEDLDQFLTNPKGYITGTKMGYGGEASPEKRADILAYLRTLADTPVPLPVSVEAPKAAATGDTKTADPAPDAKPAVPAAAPTPAKPKDKTKPQGLLEPVEGDTKTAAVTAPAMSLAPEPYHGADPYYPPASEAASPVKTEDVATNGPPLPYRGEDPQYPTEQAAVPSTAAVPSPSYSFAMTSPPLPYQGVDPQYPGADNSVAASPGADNAAAVVATYANASPPMPYKAVDPVYPDAEASSLGSLPPAPNLSNVSALSIKTER